ncbi:MAG: glycosyltransferase family 2 protein [Chloroflexi bacterium]|nr:glycosyltransferase family 2 protein [Chloroflexota bacterium]
MFISAVVCSHSLENYDNLIEAIDSLLKQTHSEREVIVVVDGNKALYEKIGGRFSVNEAVKTVLVENNIGVSGARNAGIRVARGDVIAFMDDDAFADREWMDKLDATYRNYDTIGVGGKILPVWTQGAPDYLPEELYWLAGVTHKGFAEEKIGEVRNAFGPNMSFRREVFDKVGLFNENLGFAERRVFYIQAEEPEFALRVRRETGKGVIYNPEAVVFHRIAPSKLKVRVLLKRAFYQGYSKALMKRLDITADSINTEKSYLRDLLLVYMPRRLRRFYRLAESKKLGFTVVSVMAVGMGFIYGNLKRN